MHQDEHRVGVCAKSWEDCVGGSLLPRIDPPLVGRLWRRSSASDGRARRVFLRLMRRWRVLRAGVGKLSDKSSAMEEEDWDRMGSASDLLLRKRWSQVMLC
jgi:hypothetical protein